MKKKKLFLWVMLVFWCCLIFGFSGQKAADSSNVSSWLTLFLADILEKIDIFSIPVFQDLTEIEYQIFILNLEKIVRKLAHFSIFLVLGVISFSLFKCYMERTKKCFILSLIFCLFYAVSDEFHQLFVPGRDGNIIDVLIDTTGAFWGIVFTFLLNRKNKSCSN